MFAHSSWDQARVGVGRPGLLATFSWEQVSECSPCCDFVFGNYFSSLGPVEIGCVMPESKNLSSLLTNG